MIAVYSCGECINNRTDGTPIFKDHRREDRDFSPSQFLHFCPNSPWNRQFNIIYFVFLLYKWHYFLHFNATSGKQITLCIEFFFFCEILKEVMVLISFAYVGFNNTVAKTCCNRIFSLGYYIDFFFFFLSWYSQFSKSQSSGFLLPLRKGGCEVYHSNVRSSAGMGRARIQYSFFNNEKDEYDPE